MISDEVRMDIHNALHHANTATRKTCGDIFDKAVDYLIQRGWKKVCESFDGRVTYLRRKGVDAELAMECEQQWYSIYPGKVHLRIRAKRVRQAVRGFEASSRKGKEG